MLKLYCMSQVFIIQDYNVCINCKQAKFHHEPLSTCSMQKPLNFTQLLVHYSKKELLGTAVLATFVLK